MTEEVEFEGIKLNKAQSANNEKIQNYEKDDYEIEPSRPKQRERVNNLLLLITTILIFSATSLFIAVFQITWTEKGTVFNKTIILQSQKTIGMSILINY